MKNRQRKYYIIGFVLTIVLLGTFLTVAYQNLRRSEIESKKVKSALESLHVLEDILDDMQDLESNQRGFIITGDSSFLIEFENLLGKSKKDLAKLAQFAKTDSLFSSNVFHLTAFINKKFTFSKKTVDLKSENQAEEAEKLIQSGTGKLIMDSIRKYAVLLTNQDREFLKQANEGEETAARNMNLLFASLSVAFVFILSLLFFIVRRDDRKQKKYQADINHLASLVEQTSDAIISIDLNGTTLSWNEGAAKILGYPRQEAVGKSISEMTGKGLHVLQIKLMSEELKAQGQMNAETLNYNSKGQPVHCLTSATTIRNRQGTEKGYVVVLNDITSKKETERLLYEFNQELTRQVEEKTEQIRKSEEKYRSLIEQASDAIFVNDLSGKIIEVNSKACQLLGQDHDEICRWKVTDLFAKEELDQKPIMQQELLDGETTFIERNMLRKDGKTIPVEITARMTTDNRIMAIVRDITDRKETEARLKASEKDLRNVLSSMADVFYVIDKNYRITSINETAVEMLSIAWGKPVANDANLLELIPVNSDEPILESFEKVFKGERIEYELKNNIPGLPQWVSVTFRPVRGDCGAITGACVTTKDISERKKAEEALRHSNERFELIARTTNDALWEWNLETNETWGNEMHQALYGLTLNDPVPSHQDWIQHIHADDRHQVIQSLEQALASNDNVWMADYRFLGNDTEPRYIFDRTYIVRNETGKPVRMMGIMMVITERKRAEEKLRISEERYRTLVENAAEALVVFDIQENRFVSVSDSAASLFKLSKEELLKTGPVQLSPEFQPDGTPSKEAALLKIQETMAGHKPVFEWLHLDSLGNPIHTEVRLVRMPSDKQMLIRGSIIDITERRKAEEAVRTSEETRRLIMNSALDAIVTMDKDGSISGWNPQAEKIFGWKAEEVMGKAISETIIPHKFREQHKAGVKRYMQSGDGPVLNRLIEVTALNSEGKEFPVELSIVPIEQGGNKFFCGFLRDITERKQNEQRIKREKDLSDSIINSLPGIFYIFDESGKYFRWNKNFEYVSGYNEEEIAAMQPLDFFDNSQKEIVGIAIKKAFSEGMAEVEAVISTKDKTGIPYYFNGWRIMFEGKPCLIGIGLDTTERKKAEEQIRSTTEQLRRLSAHLQNVREEERIYIAREIHDELGQQLTVLKLDVSRLHKAIDPVNAELKKQGENLIQLVNDTIKSVRRISSQLRPGMLDDLGLAAAIEWHAQEFEKRTGIKTSVTIVQQEIELSQQAANNLFRIYQEALTNVARHAHASEVNVLLGVEKSELLLSIADNGVGFNTTEAEQKTTLGLLGIRERTSALGGVCSINSVSGKGTTLEVVIPIENNQ